MKFHKCKWGKWELPEGAIEGGTVRQVRRCKRCGLHAFSMLKLVVKR